MAAAADLATVEALRQRVREWEDCYDCLAGAFALHMDILDCKQALADLASSYYDVLIGDIAAEAEYWRMQAADVLTELHTEQADHQRLRAASQLATNALFTLSYRSELDDNTRAAIKQVQLALDSALHDPVRE